VPSYATTTELTDRFPDQDTVTHLTNSNTGLPDTNVLTDVLDAAEAVLESFLAMRYEVPVDVSSDTRVAAVMRSMTLDVAQHDLIATKEFVPDAKVALHDRAIAWAKSIARGEAVLPGSDPVTSTTSRATRLKSSFDEREFTRENQAGM